MVVKRRTFNLCFIALGCVLSSCEAGTQLDDRLDERPDPCNLTDAAAFVIGSTYTQPYSEDIYREHIPQLIEGWEEFRGFKKERETEDQPLFQASIDEIYEVCSNIKDHDLRLIVNMILEFDQISRLRLESEPIEWPE